MTHHFLKTAPEYFIHVWSGAKPFEVRLDDRGYQKGDTVELAEWDRQRGCSCPGKSAGVHEVPDCAKYTGRVVAATIGHVMASTPHRGSTRGFNGNGYIVFGLCDIECRQVATVAQPSPLTLAQQIASR